ncbi:MAG: lipid-A-disaccharide synthase [Cytophagaceae bacterium]|nr:lipid-A-disaccharide synthase [Cytophagaceae bacterium]
MRYYLICGERSGDLHTSRLVAALKQKDQSALFRGIGGELSQTNGLELYRHYKDVAVMGAWEVFVKLPFIFKRIRETKADILRFKPDAVVLVDFGGFNMKIAAWAHEQGLKVFYYISPKVWAWNTGRAHKIKRVVDRMFVILSFEKEFFKQFDYEVDYVGNPLKDAVADFVPDAAFIKQYSDKQVIAVLPGSRAQEVTHMLKTMLEMVPAFPQYKWVVAGVDNLDASLYEAAKQAGVDVIYNQTYQLLNISRAALVTSGTATLETALFHVPQIVCYKTSGITYFLGKMVIKVPFISLVNLIAGKEVVKEMIQSDFEAKALKTELCKLLAEGEYRATMLKEYEVLSQKVGERGVSEKTAALMVKYLKGEQ